MLPFLCLFWLAANDLESAAALTRAGRFAEAEALAARVFATSADPLVQARAANLEGNSWLFRGGYARATSAYERALHKARDAGSGEWQNKILDNLGSAAYYQGQYWKAWQHYTEAEALQQRAAPDSPWLPHARFTTGVNQATLLQRLGKDREALAIYRALERSAPPDDHLGRGQLLANLGAVYRRLGDPYKALDRYRQALAAFERSGDDGARAGAWKNMGIAWAVDLGHYAEARKCFEQARTLARGNAREILLATLYLAETSLREGQSEAARRGFAEAARQAAALGDHEQSWRARFGLGRAAASPTEARQAFRAAIADIEALRDETRRGAARRDFLAAKRDVYDAYLESLGPHTSAAELFPWLERARARQLQDTYQPRSLSETQARLAPDETLLVTLRLPREIWLLFVTARSAGLVRLAHASGIPAALEPRLTSRLIVVPDRELTALSFDALRLPRSGQFVVERAAVSYLPASALLTTPQPAPVRWPWSPSVATAAVPMAPPGPERPPNLPLAASEANMVAGRLPGRSVVVPQASRSDIPGLLSRFPVLHIAAHAVADPADPTRTRLLMSDEPLTLASLETLSGAASPALVTLSACETAAGAELAGEGAESLAAAFLRARARAVLASLTPVSDGSAFELMRGLYAELAKGAAPAEALRSAKLRLLRSGGPLSHPEHWGPWLLYGDARSPVVAITARSGLWLVVLAAVALAAAIVRARRPAA